MITAIEGTLVATGVDWADVSVGGVTIRIHVPSSVIESLGSTGDRVHLFTSLQVKEDSLTLYGFPTSDARQAFEALLGVNGVGPKVALGVMSALSPDALAMAVAAEDTEGFKGVPGVGTRIASRIVLELKGKLSPELISASHVKAESELVQALTALGYSTPEVMRAISLLPAGNSLSLEEKVRRCLQEMTSG